MSPKRKKRPPKHSEVLKEVRKLVDAGRYWDTRHASERKDQRNITLLEVLSVLRNGYHEKRKDEFSELHDAWSYSIRGKTIDKRNLRVIVAFDVETGMLIITAIDLDKDD